MHVIVCVYVLGKSSLLFGTANESHLVIVQNEICILG